MAAAHKQHNCGAHSPNVTTDAAPDKALFDFWHKLPTPERRKLLRVDRRTLFEAIRTRYCSRCYGLFSLRFEELRCNGGGAEGDGCTACQACPACQDFFLGLTADGKAVCLEERLLEEGPFAMFAQSKARERERDLQFMTAGDVCGSGFSPKRSGKVCALHTSRVSPETLLAYWEQLPPEHRTALFSLPRHDFEAELDSCCSLQLRICKDCRYNVLAQYKLALAAGRRAAGHGRASCDGESTVSGSKALALLALPPPLMEVCEGFQLSVTDAAVQLVGTDAAALLEEAEEIEDLKGANGQDEDGMAVRHAETPELAQEALLDAVLLIFKAQVEVAFREQTAGHNALLLLVALSHELLEQRLRNAYLDVHARAAEVELLELVAEDEKKKLGARPCRRGKRGKAKAAGIKGKTAAPQAAPADPDADMDAEAAAPPPHQPGSHEAAASPERCCEGGCETAASPAAATAAAIAPAPAAMYSPPPIDAVHAAETAQLASGSSSGAEDGEWEVQQRGRRCSTSRRLSPQPEPESRLPAAAAIMAAVETPHSPWGGARAPLRQQPPQAGNGDLIRSPWAQAVAGGSGGDAPPSLLPPAVAVSIPEPWRHQSQPIQRHVGPPGRTAAPVAAWPQGVSRRNSAEYSLWGEDSGCSLPLHVSESRESLVTASSIGSPPTAFGSFGQGQPGAAFPSLQMVAESAAAALAGRQLHMQAAGGSGAFSLFCNFVPPSGHSGGGSGAAAWCSRGLPEATLFGGGGLGSGIPAMSF